MQLEADTILPSQFILGSENLDSPEKGLIFAIISDALDCVSKYRSLPRPGRVPSPEQRIGIEAREWFLAEDATYIFSFENICHLLKLHPGAIRERLQLMNWKTEHRLRSLSRGSRKQVCKAKERRDGRRKRQASLYSATCIVP